MCGIAGILSFDGDREALSRIPAMTAAMRHRGPDDEGFLFAGGRNGPLHYGGIDTPRPVYESELRHCPRAHQRGEVPASARIALGHRRLAIVDLSPAGHQPMCTEDGRYWIVFNGEVYNFRELRGVLEADGERFQSDCDTEVILKAYRRWGAEALRRFNGMWALAIWDEEDKSLFCSRDRIGIKPFYYVATPQLFVFASDTKTILASGLVKPEPAWEGVFHSMSFCCAPRPMTCFRGVRSMEPAHWMRVKADGKTESQRYWSIPVGQVDHSRSEGEWVDALADALRTSVRRRLMADVPIGSFMSGGIDSTTVSTMAALEHPNIKAFTLAHLGAPQSQDELPEARAAAGMHPMRHLVKYVSAEETIQSLGDMVRTHEEPYYSLSPNFAASRFAAESGVKVVLNGLGGDELLGGYGRHRWLRLWRMARPLRFLCRGRGSTSGRLGRLSALADCRDLADYYVAITSIATERAKRELFRGVYAGWDSPDVLRSQYHLHTRPFSDPIEALCHMDLLSYIGNHHVYRVDQFTMNFSLEGRFPLLDHEVVELAFMMPSSMKVRGRLGKYALRQVARELIPASCLTMRKKGFHTPLANWMKTSLRPLVTEKVDALKSRDVLCPREIDRIHQAFMAGAGGYAQLWFLISVEMWLEQFFDCGTVGVARSVPIESITMTASPVRRSDTATVSQG